MIVKPKVLYVVGSCLTKNTSANMSHNAFIKGFLDNNCSVDIMMAKDSWGEQDNSLPVFQNADYHDFSSISFGERIRRIGTSENTNYSESENTDPKITNDTVAAKKTIKDRIRSILKKTFYFVFKPDPCYPLQKVWIKKAKKFSSDFFYDIVVSNSCPEAAHKLVYELIKSNRINYNRWVQIWEDPWYYDVYGGMSEEIKEEEHFLLRQASEVYYVSPLTLMYQKKYYADCADKMKCIPLPFWEYEKQSTENPIQDSFGYFGDYYSVTRNLRPFYNALKESGFNGLIYGDNDLPLAKTEKIEVSGRVTLDVLSKVQNKTQILVHLSNLKGGQIPGKIYHYSATNKPILFILDGTDEEKQELRRFFGQFNRYYFCENDEASILETMKKIVSDERSFEVVDAFSPKEVVKKIINDEKAIIY